MENTTENYADKAHTEDDDDTDVEAEDVLNTLTRLLSFYADAGPIPKGYHSLIHFATKLCPVSVLMIIFPGRL